MIMRHRRILSVLTLLLAILMLGASTHASQAQEATPTPEIINRTFETLGIVNDLSLAPGLTLQLERYTWLPGVVTEMHTHPGEIDIMYVQSGEIAWSVENGEGQITRATWTVRRGRAKRLRRIRKPRSMRATRSSSITRVACCTRAVSSATRPR